MLIVAETINIHAQSLLKCTPNAIQSKPVPLIDPLLDSVSAAAVTWIIAEGVCYITGALFYSMNKRRYMHSVFHFFVLAGSICHIVAVWDVLVTYL